MPEQQRPTKRREKNPAPHRIADEPVGEVTPEAPADHGPITDTGLVVQEQVEKEWDPKKSGGLPIFLKNCAKTGTR